MKKLFLIIFVLGATYFNAQAFEGNGDVKINAGLNLFGYGSGISGSVDFGLNDWLSVGAGSDVYFSNPHKYEDSNFYLYGRLNFHLGEALSMPSQWDLYPGINLGILGNNTFGFNAHLGARYFFSEKLGMYMEIGNHGTLGISFNL